MTTRSIQNSYSQSLTLTRLDGTEEYFGPCRYADDPAVRVRTIGGTHVVEVWEGVVARRGNGVPSRTFAAKSADLSDEA